MVIMKTIWKTVGDYEGIYEVSNTGEVRSLTREITRKNGSKQVYKGKTIVQSKHNLGYRFVGLYKNGTCKKHYVHRLVLAAFSGLDEGMQVNHIDGNKSNNNLSNLEQCTASDNIKHSFKNGMSVAKRGEEKKLSKLNDKLVIQMRQEYENGRTIYSIAKEYGLNYSTASMAIRRITWKHL